MQPTDMVARELRKTGSLRVTGSGGVSTASVCQLVESEMEPHKTKSLGGEPPVELTSCLASCLGFCVLSIRARLGGRCQSHIHIPDVVEL